MSAQIKADILAFLRTMGEPVQFDEIADACGSPARAALTHALRDLVDRGGVICKRKNVGNVYMLRGSDADAATDDCEAVTACEEGATADNTASSVEPAATECTREPTPTPQEAGERYGGITARVLDCLLAATKPLVNGDIRVATGLKNGQINGALNTLRQSGLVKRYGENIFSVWVHAHAPQAVLDQVPREIVAQEHGAERGAARGVGAASRDVSWLKAAPGAGPAPILAPKAIPAPTAERPRAGKPGYTLSTHIAMTSLDVDQLLSDAIAAHAPHGVLVHLQQAASVLHLALIAHKGA